MKSLGTFEAKTKFSKIIANVAKGETYMITRRGTNVAMLVPYSDKGAKFNTASDAIRNIKKMRKGIKLGKKLSIRKLMEEGRK